MSESRGPTVLANRHAPPSKPRKTQTTAGIEAVLDGFPGSELVDENTETAAGDLPDPL